MSLEDVEVIQEGCVCRVCVVRRLWTFERVVGVLVGIHGGYFEKVQEKIGNSASIVGNHSLGG